MAQVSHVTHLDPDTKTTIGVNNGAVIITVYDRQTKKPLLALEWTPDNADEMASIIILMAARARKDGAPE